MSYLNIYKIRLSDKSKFIVKHKYASVNSEDINMTLIFRLLQIQMKKPSFYRLFRPRGNPHDLGSFTLLASQFTVLI